MATFRSNLNSVSTALKQRINTCFQHWRRLNVHQQQQQQQQHQREYYQRLYHEFHLRSFANRTSENLKNFNTKLLKFFGNSGRNSESSRGAHQRGEQIIVAKLLSSTLIATTATRTFTTTTTTETSTATDMTISDQTIMQIREEYPELSSEVRSILIARAQNGATISDIREDYRKNVGMAFPIYNNVTEYLLSIPTVSAMCNEQGTRIFNITPTAKTKHLYDMVRQQKPPQNWRTTYPSGARRRIHPYVALSKRDSGGVAELKSWRSNNNNMPPPPSQDYTHKISKTHQTDYYRNNCRFGGAVVSSTVTPVTATTTTTTNAQTQQQFVAASLETAVIESSSESERCFIDNNYYYQDNCNYLYSRLYNQQQNMTPYVMEQNFNEKEILSNLNENNNIIHNNNSKAFDQQSLLQNLNINKNNINTRPEHNFRQILSGPRNPLTSSPSGTRSSRTNESMYTSDSDYEAHLLDFPLLGDDFFLYLARMELKCKFRKFQKRLQSGLCVSGQTIRAAINRIRQQSIVDKHIIVNIGSVDIMQGRPLVQIEHDFRTLLTTMHKKGITPILTTLAPLANYSHEIQVKQKLERFNQFIKREGNYMRVIDIYSCLVNERKNTLFDCFQNEPRVVTGAVEPYVFWNKIGRQRVLQLIESNIEY